MTPATKSLLPNEIFTLYDSLGSMKGVINLLSFVFGHAAFAIDNASKQYSLSCVICIDACSGSPFSPQCINHIRWNSEASHNLPTSLLVKTTRKASGIRHGLLTRMPTVFGAICFPRYPPLQPQSLSIT